MKKAFQKSLLKKWVFSSFILQIFEPSHVKINYLKFKLQEKSTVLTQIRKQKTKKLPEDLATFDDIKAFQVKGSHTVILFDSLKYLAKNY